MVDFEFQYPWVAMLLLPLLAVAVWQLMRHGPSLSIPSFSLLPRRGKRLSFFQILPLVLYSLTGVCLILGLMGPRFDSGIVQQKFQGVDIILGIDLSGSMQAYDVPTDLKNNNEIRRAFAQNQIKQRIDACKDAVLDFVEKRPNDRIGLIAFADQAFAICPPTLDHAWLEQQIKSLSLNSIGEGTGIAAPIAAAVERMKKSDAKRKILVLFTDGENTVANRISPAQAADIAKRFDVVIHTVGIGGKHAFVEQNFMGSTQLIPYPSHFDEKLLNHIAEVTEGKYYRASDQEAMKEVMAEIDKLETQQLEMPRIVLYQDATYHFAALAILFLLISFLASHVIFLRYP